MKNADMDGRMSRDRQDAGHTAFGSFAAAVALALGIFVLFFLAYRVRHYPMPVGFDAPWYVWRADFVSSQGLGPLGTAVRPGHALLAAVLGSITGRTQLELQVLLPLVLTGMLALSAGAFFAEALGGGRWGWLIATVVAGGFLGATRLVGENVANLLFLGLAGGAMVLLDRTVQGQMGFVGTVALLVAAGLAHWIFLAVLGAVLAVAAVLSLPESGRQRRAGRSLLRTDAGVVVATAVATTAAMAVMIAGILRAPFQTVEIRENPRRFVPKLRTDLSRILWPVTGPVVAAGAVALERVRRPPRTRFGLRLLLAWTLVTAVGIAYGMATRKLPPHRFLALWVGFPGVLLLAAAVIRASEFLRARGGPVLSVAVAAAGVAGLAAIGANAWYSHGPGVWLSPVAVQESESVANYVGELPQGRPFVVLIGPLGKAGVLSPALKERTVRVALPPERQPDAHFFVGDPTDLMAGRRTPLGPGLTDATNDYWNDVRTVLPGDPPVLVVRALAEKEYAEAVSTLRARVVAPGVALLQGPSPPAPFPAASVPNPVPRVRSGIAWGLALVVLLFVAGSGWTIALAGFDAPAEVLAGLSPAVGAAAIILFGLAAAKLGVRLGGAGGVVTYMAAALTGAVVAVARWRRSS